MKKQNKNISLFEIVCNDKHLGYKIVVDNVIYENIKPVKTHSICYGCMINTYMSIGIIPQYKNGRR